VSKAFTKEDSAVDPVLVPPRAPLPPGVPNYVTARGLARLRAEQAALERERAELLAEGRDDAETKRRTAVLAGRLADLVPRVASAEVVDPRGQPRGEVRFGANVTLRTLSGPREGEEQRLQIVGVDEADASQGRIAFAAPIARAMTGLHVGESAVVHLPRGDEEIEVVAIDYEDDAAT
jgi:transcription elongation factor GreB